MPGMTADRDKVGRRLNFSVNIPNAVVSSNVDVLTSEAPLNQNSPADSFEIESLSLSRSLSLPAGHRLSSFWLAFILMHRRLIPYRRVSRYIQRTRICVRLQ
ncbi:hypothetical protein NMG60_11030377 [Bertholletia excelsa]